MTQAWVPVAWMGIPVSGERLAFELGVDAQRRGAHALLNGTDHPLVGRFTARW